MNRRRLIQCAISTAVVGLKAHAEPIPTPGQSLNSWWESVLPTLKGTQCLATFTLKPVLHTEHGKCFAYFGVLTENNMPDIEVVRAMSPFFASKDAATQWINSVFPDGYVGFQYTEYDKFFVHN